jgi:hypothetical protein
MKEAHSAKPPSLASIYGLSIALFSPAMHRLSDIGQFPS